METLTLLDGGGWWVVRMILDVEEEAVGSVLDFFSCALFDVRTGIGDCLLEDRQNAIVVVSAGHKPAVEQPQFCSNVQRT